MKNRGCLVASALGVAASVSGTVFLSPAAFAQPSPVPFVICAESFDWTRPGPSVQAKIWNDNRYKEIGPSAYEWTHDFVLTEPDSASLTYHSENLSGLWTAGPRTHCQRHDGDPGWIDLWTLNHHVASMTLEADLITVTAEHRENGFEILQFQRPSSLGSAHATIRFVNARGEVLDQLVERTPLLFVPAR